MSTIKLRRSAVSGNNPSTSQLDLGEVAINTHDGKMFFKRDKDGELSIVELGGAAVQGQIDSSATSYTLDFITTNGNTTTNNIEVGTINTLQVNNGNGDDAFSTAVGFDALVNANSGTLRNTAFGRDALEDNTSGERNTALGQGAMANATTGSYNTAIGMGVMGSGIVTGNFNTALGITALNNLTSGTFNTAIGSQSPLGNTTTGQSNVAIGPYTLINNEEGSYNVAVGRSALAGASLGDYTGNIAIGANALDNLEPGQNNNTVIGYRAGRDLDSGTRNTIIGFDAEASATFINDEITLGDDANKSFRIPGSQFYINGGSEGTTGSNVGIGTNAPTGKVEIEDDGAVNDRLLYLNSAGGLAGGQSGPFYGLYADIKSNNSATKAYGAYIEAEGGTTDDTYGIWAQATQSSSTVDAIGVLGKTIVNSGSTNHGSSRALGTGPAAGVYALAETTGTGTASQTTALHASNASTHGSLAYGAYIETISGPTTVVPLKVDHDGSEIFKLDSAGNATISGTVNLVKFEGDSATVASAATAVIATAATSSFNAIEATIVSENATNGNRQISKVLLTHDTTDTYMNEYAVITTTDSDQFTMDADISGSDFRLKLENVSGNTLYAKTSITYL